MSKKANASPASSSAIADNLFVGWLPMPVEYARFLRPIALLLIVSSLGLGVAIAFSQRNPGPGRWESEHVQTLTGIVYVGPYAMLRVAGESLDAPPRTLLLVKSGKFGALPRVRSLCEGKEQGVAVRVTGTLLHRDGRQMFELAEGENGLQPLSPADARRLTALARPEPEVIEQQIELIGEIIDPKCYLGAMKPGGGKTHKACAMLCIAGGVPPMLAVRDGENQESFFLLTTKDGREANELIKPFVGDHVKLAGRLERHGDLLVLKIDAVNRV